MRYHVPCSLGSSSVWCFFFFSSRRRHTRFKCDWSSDVCSSDLVESPLPGRHQLRNTALAIAAAVELKQFGFAITPQQIATGIRSEERRVGKECRSRWSPYH